MFQALGNTARAHEFRPRFSRALPVVLPRRNGVPHRMGMVAVSVVIVLQAMFSLL
jgi:hypothetical protein